MTLTTLTTKTGKTIQDFTIPEKLMTDEQLITLIMQSESMKDEERQYWFNLTEVMTPEQIEKLRGILTREKQKLAEIDAKYASSKTPTEDPAVVAQRAQKLAAHRAAEQAKLREREQAHEEKENAEQEAVLAELESL